MKNLIIDIEKHFPPAYKIFEPADYYSPFIPLDKMVCHQIIPNEEYCIETYNIHPILNWENLDNEYEYVVIVWPIHSFDDFPYTPNVEERRDFFEKIFNDLNKKNIKRYIYLDGSDRAIIKRGLDWLDSNNYRCDIVFKREYRKNFEYDYDKNRVFPFPFSVFGKPNPSWILYESKIDYNIDRIDSCFWAGSPIYRNDEFIDEKCDRLSILNKIYHQLSIKNNLDHKDFLNEMKSHNFFLNLNGTGHLCKRFFEGLSTGSLMLMQETDLIFPFDDGDFFSRETIFSNANEFIEKYNLLKNNKFIYDKCIENQRFIVEKYFNYNWIRNYIYKKINMLNV